MIDIKLSDKNGNEITSCGCGLSPEKEKVIYFALKKGLLNYYKLIEVFGYEK